MSAAQRYGWALAAALGLLGAAGSAGCNNDAYCFANCTGEGGGEPTSTSSGADGGGGSLFTGSGGSGGDCFPNCMGTGGAAGGGPCTPTNGGAEICDDLDNDCNGTVDDVMGVGLGSIQSCGTCDNNCLLLLTNCQTASITCTPSPNPGVDPGTCNCGACDPGWWDLDGNETCEYPCIQLANDDDVCNNLDDDCDGTSDEDVDLCNSLTNCGKCGNNCVVLHGTPSCDGPPVGCDETNTQCGIAACDCAPGDCWWNIDGSVATGCEYPCETTNGGVEICGDNIDNDCDGLIDGADSLSGDPAIGLPCYGDPDGVCATAAHQGMTICSGGQVICGGANVLVQNQLPETCNAQDDDCDGTVDDSPQGVGTSCGQSNVFPCSLGSFQCQGGTLTCVGAVNPGTETCNGIDDNCDGQIDSTGGVPPPDATGLCNIPPAAPPGAMQVCQPGSKACIAGQVVCQGSVGPSAPTDACGADSNCDGVLTNQPNLQTDNNNCGSCGNNCYAGSVHSIWTCNAGTCQFQGCEQGYVDLDGNQTCETACTFIQQQEICNGIDDNCNGSIDENVIAPSPVQVCGVNPAATSPACTSGVSVTCQNGAWTCGFQPGVCNPTCATAVEICDTLDNNCNGLTNENVASYGQPCASDDGLPPPGHGACRTTGSFVCTGPNTAACSATKASCTTLPGGCTENCDGVDNDCDGLVDETFNNKGIEPAYFVKPTVTRTSTTNWMYTYEAARPNATNASPGSGNGYYCTGAGCAGGVPPAPAGVTLDRTPACSVPDRIPWFNVTPAEVEQTCQAMGGFICTTSGWTGACQAGAGCQWGYASACTSSYTTSKYCNLGPSFDFSPASQGDQDGLLPTASASLQNCWANWAGMQGNVFPADHLYDITGNLREITRSGANVYPLMGGAFNSAAEGGATCSFSFYAVDPNYKLFDVGFRCCFSINPTL